MDAKTALSLNIVELRKKYKLSQGELADRIGMSRKTLSLIENCHTWADYSTVQALAKVLKVEESDLFTDPKMLESLKYLMSRK